MRLLSKCLDKSKTMSATVVEDVCQLVAVDESVQPCMSLGPYLGNDDPGYCLNARHLEDLSCLLTVLNMSLIIPSLQ